MGVGIIGIFLPLLPTTVFMLIALWAFSKSSKRLHDYIWHHPRFGAAARDWKLYGIVPRRAKIGALLLILTSSALVLFVLSVPKWAAVTAVAIMAVVLLWLLSRPEKPAV